MNADAISGTSTVKPGPPDTPVADRQSNTVGYNTTNSGITATWGSVNLSDRVATSVITFSTNPGSSFNVGFDVRIQKKNGITYSDEAKTAWDLTSTSVSGQPTQRTIVADPSPSVEAGTYRFILVSGALGTGTGGETSNDFTIGEDMAIPAATINNGFFDPDTDIVRFYVTWVNVNQAQLRQFDRDDIEIKDSATGLAIMAIGTNQITVQNSDGYTFPVDIAIPSDLSGSLYIRIKPNRFSTTSYATRSSPVSYNTLSMTTPARVTFSFTGIFNSPSSNTPLTEIGNRASVYLGISSGSTSISDFRESDIIVSGGCSSGLEPSSGSASSWRLRIDMTNETAGRINVYIPENTIGNGNDAVQTSYNFDRRSSRPATAAAPHINGPYTTATGSSITPQTDGKITADSFYVRIGFGQSGITGFVADDIMVVNASKGSFAPVTPGNTWSLQIMNQAGFDGNVNVLVPSGITSQSGSNTAVQATFGVRRPSTATTPNPVTFTIRDAYTGREPEGSGVTSVSTPFGRAVSTVYIDIICSEVVSDFTADDINIGNGCVGQFHAVVQGDSRYRGRRWTIEVGIKEGESGFMDVNIPPNVVQVGNPNAYKQFEFNRSVSDAEPATVSIGGAYTSSGDPDDGGRGSLITGTINNTNNPTGSFWVPITVTAGTNSIAGFTVSDVTVYGACKGTDFVETITGSQWNVHIDPDDNFEGWITVAVAANVMTQSGGNTPDSRSFKIDYSRATITANPTTFTIGNAYSIATGGTVVSNGSTTISDRNRTVYVHITSSRAIADFGDSDIIISNGCIGQLTEQTGTRTNPIDDNTQWRIEVGLENETAGRMTVTIPPNAVSVGNLNESKSFPYDLITEIGPPVNVTIGTARTDLAGATNSPLTNGNITASGFYVPIDFGGSVNIDGFRASDITVINACKGALSNAGDIVNGVTVRGVRGRSFMLHVDNEDNFEGIVTVAIPTDAISNSNGNLATSENFNVNTIPSKAVFTIGDAYDMATAGTALTTLPIRDKATIYVQIEQTDNGIEVLKDDLNGEIFISNGCVGTLERIQAKRWRIEVGLTNNTEGTMTVSIPPNVVSRGNDGITKAFTYDRIEEDPDAVSVTIGTPRSDSSGTTILHGDIRATDFYVPITFGGTQTITGFIGTDQDGTENGTSEVIVTNACKGNLTALAPRSGEIWATGRSFILHVDNQDSFKGVVTVSIPTDVISNDGGNTAATRNFNVNTTTDPDSPTTFTVLEAYANSTTTTALTDYNRENMYVEISSTEAVTDFTASDVIVSGGCAASSLIKRTGAMIDDNTRWRLYIDMSDNESGYITVAIPANAVSRGNEPESKTFSFGADHPYLEVVSLPTDIQTGRTITLTIQSKVDGTRTKVSGLTASDIIVTDSDNSRITSTTLVSS